LDAVLDTISVEALRIPERILDLIPPTAFGYGGGTAEPFEGRTEPTFDPISAATIAADISVSTLLNPQRAARVNEHGARNPHNPNFSDVVAALVAKTWTAPAPSDAYGAAIQRAAQSLVVTRLMDLASNADAAPQVRANALQGLRDIAAFTRTSPASRSAHFVATRDDIDRFLKRPADTFKKTEPLATPPGEPIGSRGGR
jgi:hypothetical protein